MFGIFRRKKKGGWRRVGLWILAVVAVGLYGFYRWQPWEFDFIPRKLPNPNPWTLPEPDRLFAKGTRVTVVTAHPDDAEFYIGGLLTKLHETGATVSLVVCTDGDKGYYPFSHPEALRATRRAEQREGAAKWGGTDVTFLGYPDGRLQDSDEVVAAIARELNRLEPEYVLMFDGNFPPRFSHRDHRRSGLAAERAARQAGVGRWLLHFSTSAPNYAVDVTKEWPAKMDLLAVHRSQFNGSRLAMIRNMVSRRGRADGKLVGSEYAEGLRVERGPANR